MNLLDITTHLRKRFLLFIFTVLTLIPISVCGADINISSPLTVAQILNANGQKLTVSNGGDLTVSGIAVAASASSGLLIGIASGNAANGIKTSGSNNAIAISGTATLSELDLVSGIISSAKSGAGTIAISGTTVDSATKIVTQAGTVISNNATSGFAIDSTSTANRTIILENSGTISVNDNGSSIAIKLSDSNGGSNYFINNRGIINVGDLGKAINVGTASSVNSIAINNASSASIIGAIALSTNDNSTITNNGAIDGNISATSANLDIINSGVISGNITLGSNADSTLAMSGGTISGNIKMNNATQSTIFGGGSLVGNIDGAGQLLVNDHATLNGNVGATTGLTSIIISAGNYLDAAANNNSVKASTISLDNDALLKMGSGALSGTVQGVSDGVGAINFSDNNILSANIGTATNSLASVTISEGKILTISSHQIDATNIIIGAGAALNKTTGTLTGNIIIGSGGILTTTTGVITGMINGLSDGDGTVNFNNSFTLISGNSIGQTHNLDSVNIANGATLTASESIAANNINIGTGISGVLTINSVGKTLGGNVNIGNGAIFNISSEGIAVNSDIKGANDAVGTLNINQNFTSNGDLGTQNNALSAINIASGKLLDAGTNNNNINATNINLNGPASTLTLGTGATSGNIVLNSASAILNVGSGVITGNINGTAASRGIVNFAQDFSLAGNIGNDFSLSAINIAAGKTLIAGSNNIAATYVNIDSGAILEVDDGTVTGTIRGTYDAVGTIKFTQDFTTNGDLGSSTNSLANIVVADGKALNMSDGDSINSTKLILGSGSVLNVNDEAISALIQASSDKVGSINFAENTSVSGAIGTSANSLAQITIADGVTLTTTSASIDAANIVIGDGANLILGHNSFCAAVNGSADGVGTLTLHYSNIFNADSSFGTTNSLAEIKIDTGATITANQSINANLVYIGGGTSGTLNLGANQSISGDVNIAKGGTLNLNDHSTVLGAINGAESGVGNLKIATNSVYIANGDIGATNALANLTINDSASFVIGGDLAVNNIKNSGIMVFGDMNRHIAGSLSGTGDGIFDFNSGAHFISESFTVLEDDILKLQITNPTSAGNLTVGGIATISDGTNLAVDFDTSIYIPNNTIYNIVSGASGSLITAIADDKININSSGTNKSGTLIFTTRQSGDNLILTVNRDPAPSFAADNADNQTLYDIINFIGVNATGEMRALQNYLDSPNFSDSQKGVVLESITSQLDNSANIISSSAAKFSLNIADDRLQNLHQAAIFHDETKKRGLWGKFFGGDGNQGNSDDAVGSYDIRNYGFAFGADKEIARNFDLGIAASYAKSSIDYKTITKNTNVDSYQINAYGGFAADKFFINGIAGLALNKYNSSRTVEGLGFSANADYGGQTYLAKVESGMDYDLEDGITLTPIISLLFLHNKIGEYTETGAGTLNLSAQSYKTNFLEGRAGGILNYNFTYNGMKLNPQLTASVGHDFIGDEAAPTCNFVGYSMPFKSQSQTNQKSSIMIGSSVNIYAKNSVTFSADYNMEHKKRYNANYAGINLRYNF